MIYNINIRDMTKDERRSDVICSVNYDEIQNKMRSLKDIQHLYSSIDATFEPGTEWRYSNTGMVLLGQVIENVTGENYYDYINENVYKKHGF